MKYTVHLLEHGPAFPPTLDMEGDENPIYQLGKYNAVLGRYQAKEIIVPASNIFLIQMS